MNSGSGGVSSGGASGVESAGAPGQGGAASGGMASGGASSGGSASGGSGTGGNASNGGSSSATGGGSGARGGTTAAGGNSAQGGAAGSTSSGGSSAGSTSVTAGSSTGGNGAASTPSAGCSKGTPRPSNGVVTQSDRIYSFPTSYDGKKPMPLLIGLHAAGNPNTQIQNLTNGTRLESNFVRIFPKSAGSAWVYNTDVGKVNSVYEDVLANYCIDTSRVFATGHSSGAQMVVQMLCNGEKRWKAVAPVAASKYCNKFSPIPVMYIQGMMDAQRGGGNGIDVVNMFTASNMCSSTSMPKNDVPTCTSTFDKKTVTPGCVTYQNCAVPTVWCSHNDNGYNNTDGKQHGWPCFASNAIADFFMSLP
jgi:poly(3-hydroxybutyrate) depolymerase